MNIQWYPGHMTKARRMLEENLKLIDVVVELLDARAPRSTRNPDLDKLFAGKYRVVLLNKCDLADKSATAEWIEYFNKEGIFATELVSTNSGRRNTAISIIEKAAGEKVERMKKKGVIKTVRAMVVGIPNVGKSTFINMLAKSSRAAVGDRPGVTQGKQWVKIGQYLEVMDTPGMLWPKFEDEIVARHIAYIGSVRDDILDVEALAQALLSELLGICPAQLSERYKGIAPDTPTGELLETVCRARGFMLKGGEPDTLRAAKTVLDEFRAGKIARITLETPLMVDSAENLGALDEDTNND